MSRPVAPLVAAALAVNAGLLAAGIWLELHPRSRADVWRGAAIWVLGLVNVLAVTLAGRPTLRLRPRYRLWRIAFLTNSVLLIVALGLTGAALAHEPAQAIPYALLLLPAGLTLLALRRPPAPP